MSEPRRPGSSKLTAENLHDYIAGRIPDPWPLVRELTDALEDLQDFTRTYGHGKCYELLARATAALKLREGVGHG